MISIRTSKKTVLLCKQLAKLREEHYGENVIEPGESGGMNKRKTKGTEKRTKKTYISGGLCVDARNKVENMCLEYGS